MYGKSCYDVSVRSEAWHFGYKYVSGGVLAIAEGRSGFGTALLPLDFFLIALCCFEWGSLSNNLHRKKMRKKQPLRHRRTASVTQIFHLRDARSSCKAANSKGFTAALHMGGIIMYLRTFVPSKVTRKASV